MCQRVLPRTSFEERLPEGWFLGLILGRNGPVLPHLDTLGITWISKSGLKPCGSRLGVGFGCGKKFVRSGIY